MVRDRYEKAEGRRNESLPEAFREGSLLDEGRFDLDSVEKIHNARYRAQEADKRGYSCEGGKDREIVVKAVYFDLSGAVQGF